MPKPQTTRMDRFIRRTFPAWAARRQKARAWCEYYERVQTFGDSYRAAVNTRTDDTWADSFINTGQRHLRRENLEQLRNRARQLDRNNIIASGMLDRAEDNIIGTGMRLQVRTPNTEFNERAEEMWRRWEPTADVQGLRSFTDLERLILRAHLRDGDVGIVLVGDGRLQPIEGDLIRTPDGRNRDRKATIIDGVEVNRFNRPVRYHISTRINGKASSDSVDANDFVFLPRLKRLNQIRGEPAFSQVFPLFDQIDGYVEAAVIAARMAAMFGLLIHTQSGAPGALPTRKDSGGTTRPELEMEPGMVHYLGMADEIEQIKPQQPTQSFPDFLAMLLRFCGVSIGLPLELVLMDFSRTNFSSAKGSLLQAYRHFRCVQNYMIDRFYTRIYRWRVSKWIKAGDLPDPGTDAKGRPIAWQHVWVPAGWQWLDPVKEAQAIALKLDLGLTTRAIEATSLGFDFEELQAQIEKEEAMIMAARNGPAIRSNLTRDVTGNGNGNGTRRRREPIAED